MSRGLGKTERRILEYLNEKAKKCKVTEMKTIGSYASTSEIAERLNISPDCVCQAINALEKSGRIQIFPNGRRRNRYFGSPILPRVTPEEVSSTIETILSINNF